MKICFSSVFASFCIGKASFDNKFYRRKLFDNKALLRGNNKSMYLYSMKQRTLDELDSSFALFDNWDDRYRFLIDLGKRLPIMDENLKTDTALVPGCTSRVWLVAKVDDDAKLHFWADSDAQIVRGLIYLLMSAYQDQSTDHIVAIDINKVFEGLGLHQHLSPNRRNGFFAMVEKIKQYAQRSECNA